jgi:hypothetical protein
MNATIDSIRYISWNLREGESERGMRTSKYGYGIWDLPAVNDGNKLAFRCIRNDRVELNRLAVRSHDTDVCIS